MLYNAALLLFLFSTFHSHLFSAERDKSYPSPLGASSPALVSAASFDPSESSSKLSSGKDPRVKADRRMYMGHSYPRVIRANGSQMPPEDMPGYPIPPKTAAREVRLEAFKKRVLFLLDRCDGCLADPERNLSCEGKAADGIQDLEKAYLVARNNGLTEIFPQCEERMKLLRPYADRDVRRKAEREKN